MRLGLIGTGKQGQRYLQEKNGGRHIVVSGSRRIPLDGVDGVIIATHPAGHKELALEAIAAGKAVLIEKPLALNLRDCMEIIDAAEKADVGLEVAHIDLWRCPPTFPSNQLNYCSITYERHDRDYSPWLDWAPHGLALLERFGTCSAACLAVSPGDHTEVSLMNLEKQLLYKRSVGTGDVQPMAMMVRDFMFGVGGTSRYDFQRRVYRALFAEE